MHAQPAPLSPVFPATAPEVEPGSGEGHNSLSLTAILSERETLRYNMSGVPVTECTLLHESRQLEAGLYRQVRLEVSAVAIGDLARELAGIDPGARLKVEGFLTPLRRTGRVLCLHLTRIDQY